MIFTQAHSIAKISENRDNTGGFLLGQIEKNICNIHNIICNAQFLDRKKKLILQNVYVTF